MDDNNNTLAGLAAAAAASEAILSNVTGIARRIGEIRDAVVAKELAVGFLAKELDAVWDRPMMAVVGKGEDAPRYPFTLGDMYQPRNYANGDPIGCNVFVGACYATLAVESGVEGGFTTKDKQELKRAYRLAAAKRVLAVDIRWHDTLGISMPAAVVMDVVEVKTEEIENSEGEVLKVEVETPTAYGRDLMERLKTNATAVDPDAPEMTDEQAFAAAKAIRLYPNGKKHPVYGDMPAASTLSDKFKEPLTAKGCDNWEKRKPKPEKSDAAVAETDPTVVFTQSLDYVLKCLSEVLDSDESDFAPTDAIEAKLCELHDKIGAFISATVAGAEPEPEAEPALPLADEPAPATPKRSRRKA